MGDPVQPSDTTGAYPELPMIETTPAVELEQTGGPEGQVIPQPKTSLVVGTPHLT